MANLAFDQAATSPKRWQWEASSGSPDFSQSNNCGPTCITFIAGFYNRTSGYGIETTRRLIGGMGPYNVNGSLFFGAPPGTPTQPWQQRDMLIKRGVAAEVRAITTLGQLRDIVRGGQHPVLIGMLMSAVPDHIKDHTFDGWHAVVVLDVVDGDDDFWIMDPNFHPPSDGFRIDPDHGRKRYPGWVVQAAMLDSSPATAWAVVPLRARATPDTRGRGRLKVGGTLRTDNVQRPETSFARAKRDGFTYRLRDGARLWANTKVYYFFGWDSRKRFARVATASGRRFFIHRDEFDVTRWP